jgi:hypothetical protein
MVYTEGSAPSDNSVASGKMGCGSEESPSSERPYLGMTPVGYVRPLLYLGGWNQRRPIRLILAVCLGLAAAAVDRTVLAAPGIAVEGSSMHAMRGIHQLEDAAPLSDDSWVVSFGGAYFRADDLALAGEHHQRSKWRGAFAFSPWGAFDLGLTWTTVSNSSRPVLASSTQTTGDPELLAKWAHTLGSELALGALLQILVPTSESGSGLAFDATTITGQALATYRPSRRLALACNAGYRFDNTRNTFSSTFAAGQETLMRFNGNIARTSAVVGGLGAVGRFQASPRLLAAPFLELVAAVAPTGSFKDSPIAATIGAKALLSAVGVVEVAAGTSVRITGAPSATSKFPGLPPWEAFLQLSFHPGAAPAKPEPEAEPAVVGPDRCDDRKPCREHFACVEGACLPVKEVVREVVKTPPTFVISGGVTDLTTGAPIREATIRISGSDSALLTDDQGTFVSWPIGVDDGLVRVSAIAPGFRQAQQELTKGPAGETRGVSFELVPLGKKVNGTIRGSLRDKGTGMPVVGTLTIPGAGKKVFTTVEGNFTVDLPAGRHQLLITATDMKPQEKRLTIGPGEVVILNIDMTPQRR